MKKKGVFLVCVEVDQNTFVLPRRPRDAHKGAFGRVGIWAGSVGYTGAPVFAARAAVRTGSGLVFLHVPEEIWSVVAARCDEAMPFPLPAHSTPPANRWDAALIGPGLGADTTVRELARSFALALDRPLVLDADGLNAFAPCPRQLCSRTAPTILTPHEGEFARLTGCTLPVRDRVSAARHTAQELNCVVVLKGHRTVTAAPDGRVWVNTGGNPGMAKGGSGDILAGIILSLLGQGFPAAESAAMGVWLHSRSGDLCAAQLGEYAMTPTDLLDFLPHAIKELERPN